MIENRFLIPGLLTVAAVAVLLYFVGVIPESVAALGLGCGIVLIACWYAYQKLGDGAETKVELGLTVGVTVAVAILAIVPVVSTLFPGSPRAQGSVHAAGDSVKLPEDARGTVRILLHGRVGGQGAADASVVLALGDQKLNGHFKREPKTVRMGRRGRSTVMRENNSQFISATVPSNVDRIEVETVRGPLAGPVEVQVFRDWIPENVEMIAAVILILAASLLAARFGKDGAAPGAVGLALIFGIMIHHIATPEVAIQPEMGSLVVGGIGGLVGGSVLTWLCRRFITPRSSEQRKPARA